MSRHYLDLGYRGPTADLQGTGASGADAFRALAAKLEQAAARCREVASLIQSNEITVNPSTLEAVINGAAPDDLFAPFAPEHIADIEFAQKSLARVLTLVEGIEEGKIECVGREVQAVAPMCGAVLADAFAQVELHDQPVIAVVLNPVDFADMRKFARDILDPETRRAVLTHGIQGTVWGAMVLATTKIPAGFVYVLPENGPQFSRIRVDR